MIKLITIAAVASLLLISCEDTSDDPVTPPVLNVVDSVTIDTEADTLSVFALKENSSAYRSQTVYIGRPTRKLSYDVNYTATSITRGQMTIKYTFGVDETWTHVFTKDPSTWVVSKAITGAINTFAISSDSCTGRMTGRTVGH